MIPRYTFSLHQNMNVYGVMFIRRRHQPECQGFASLTLFFVTCTLYQLLRGIMCKTLTRVLLLSSSKGFGLTNKLLHWNWCSIFFSHHGGGLQVNLEALAFPFIQIDCLACKPKPPLPLQQGNLHGIKTYPVEESLLLFSYSSIRLPVAVFVKQLVSFRRTPHLLFTTAFPPGEYYHTLRSPANSMDCRTYG